MFLLHFSLCAVFGSFSATMGGAGEAVCLIIDVGATASAILDDKGHSFLDAALECASLFVERKLFAETKDEIGIVLFGTEATQNPLDYAHVTVRGRGLARPDWETVAYLR